MSVPSSLFPFPRTPIPFCRLLPALTRNGNSKIMVDCQQPSANCPMRGHRDGIAAATARQPSVTPTKTSSQTFRERFDRPVAKPSRQPSAFQLQPRTQPKQTETAVPSSGQTTRRRERKHDANRTAKPPVSHTFPAVIGKAACPTTATSPVGTDTSSPRQSHRTFISP